jgi:hypothetical protein
MIGLGFINDTTFAARSDSFEEANAKLKHLMEKENGALRWEERYSGSNKCPNVCMFSTKVDTPQHLLTRALMCEYIK